MKNTYLKLHEPISMGAAIKIDKPWDGGANGGNCVVQGDGKYHMYYRSMHYDVGPDPEVHNCVAISDDGITWTKPILQEKEGTNFVEIPAFYDEPPVFRAMKDIKAFFQKR